jgi:hypothetical protein
MDQKATLDGLMLSYWDEKWDALSPKSKELYPLALKDCPMPCVEAACREIKMAERFRVVPNPRALAEVAFKEFRRWREGKAKMKALSPEQRDISILVDLCAEIQDKSGTTWRFVEGGMEDPVGKSFHGFVKFTPAQIQEVIQRAKSKYGNPLPTPVYVSLSSPEGKDLLDKARALSKSFASHAVEVHDATGPGRGHMTTGKLASQPVVPKPKPPAKKKLTSAEAHAAERTAMYAAPEVIAAAREKAAQRKRELESPDWVPEVDFDALRQEVKQQQENEAHADAHGGGGHNSGLGAEGDPCPGPRPEFDPEPEPDCDPDYDPPAF